MAFPDTSLKLEAAGYKFAGKGKCKYCAGEIYWFETPRGKKLPVSRVEGSDHAPRCEPHFNACKEYKGEKK